MIQFTNAITRYNNLILDDLKSTGIICWVAGGSLRDYFMGKPIKTDHDLFFPNEIEYQKTATWFKAKDAVIKWESDNGMKVVYDGKTFDLVKHFYTGPQECIDSFDFTVSMFACDGEKIYHGESSFIDLSKRQLMLNKIPFPASTMSRAFRYYKKGFSMCLGEMKRLFEAIQNMPKPEETEGAQTEETEQPSSGEMEAFFTGID